jgi:hypothetical protein
VTVDQLVKPLRIMDEAQRQRALNEAVNTPAIQKAMKARSEMIRSSIYEQIDFKKLSPSLKQLMQEQSETVRQMLDSSSIRKAIANINFTLPEGLVDQIAAYRDQLAAEVIANAEAADPEVAEERVGRLAEERESIIKCLRRIGIVLEGFSYLPESPIPPLVGFLILLLAALGEVADEILGERGGDSA